MDPTNRHNKASFYFNQAQLITTDNQIYSFKPDFFDNTSDSKQGVKRKLLTEERVTFVPSKAAKIEVGDECPIRTVSSKKFSRKLEKIRNFQSVDPKLLLLKAICTPRGDSEDQDPTFWQLWIEYSPPSGDASFLNFMIFDGEFESNTLAETAFEILQPNSTASRYHYIKVFENNELDEPLLQIRINPQNNLGEIIYIKKGNDKTFTGETVLNLGLQILDSLNVPRTFLHDDSKIPVKYKEGRKKISTEIPLRLYRVLSEQGETWYGKKGFFPVDARGMQTTNPDYVANQDIEKYYLAVVFLCNIRLDEIELELSAIKHPATKTLTQLKSILNSSELDQATLSDLARALTKAYRETKSEESTQNYVLFYNTFLSGKFFKKAQSPFLSKFERAVKTVKKQIIWERNVRDEPDFSLASFKSAVMPNNQPQ